MRKLKGETMTKRLTTPGCSAGTLLFVAQMAAAEDFDRFQMPVSNPFIYVQ
jgi:hypothetical protein